jgi:VanZ family protein
MALSKFVRWKLPAVFWASLILVLTSYPTLDTPDLGFEAQDKLAHFGFYFVLGFLIVRALSENDSARIRTALWRALAIGVLFALFDEAHQLFIPGRSCEFYDASADVIGILLSLLAFLLLHRTKVKQNKMALDVVKIEYQNEEL